MTLFPAPRDWFPRLAILLAALWFGVAGGAAQAATFTALPLNDNRCAILLEGEIVAGDAERFKQAQEQAREIRSSIDLFDSNQQQLAAFSGLCLDSPGGSYVEAIRIIDAMQGRTATVIPRDGTCLSACALVFMAGGYRTENEGSVLARVMDVSSTLGFHAPALTVAEGNYNAEQVQRAYMLSVRAIAELVSRKDQIVFPDTLLSAMLFTPPGPESFFYVDTVGKAARWDITVSGVTPPRDITPAMAHHACMNTVVEASDAESRGVSIPYWLDAFGTGNALSIEDDGTFARVQVRIGNEAGAWSCEFTYRRGHDIFDWVDQDTISSDLYFGRFGPAFFFDENTPLAAIADGATPGDIPVRADSWKTTCFVLRGTDIIDRDPCTATVVKALDEKLGLKTTTTYLWPSGAKTMLSFDEYGGSTPFERRINGAPIRDSFLVGEYIGPEALRGAMGEASCVINDASGNTFCYASE